MKVLPSSLTSSSFSSFCLFLLSPFLFSPIDLSNALASILMLSPRGLFVFAALLSSFALFPKFLPFSFSPLIFICALQKFVKVHGGFLDNRHQLCPLSYDFLSFQCHNSTTYPNNFYQPCYIPVSICLPQSYSSV